MTKTGLAKMAGISMSSVMNWQRQGMPVNEDGTVNPWAVAEWKFGRDTGADPDKKTPLNRKLAAEAELKELELAEEKGEVARLPAMVKRWEGAVMRCRARLLALPSKAAPQVLGCSSLPEVKDLLDKFVYESLEELASDGAESEDRETGDETGDSDSPEAVPAAAASDPVGVG